MLARVRAGRPHEGANGRCRCCAPGQYEPLSNPQQQIGQDVLGRGLQELAHRMAPFGRRRVRAHHAQIVRQQAPERPGETSIKLLVL